MDQHDVAVIGAGVVGTAIARELSRYDLSVVILEAGDDVGAGTSKANTAILHTGYDAPSGTLEARLVARGHSLLSEFAAESGVPIEPLGGLLVAWDEAQEAALPGIAAKARQNGYDAIRPVDRARLYTLEPNLGPGARAALHIPDEGIVCPFTPPLAFATEAIANGAHLLLGARVHGVQTHPGQHVLDTARGPVATGWVVNAAGLWSDEVDRMFGHAGFTVTPRRGELVVFDKLARPLLDHIILPVPTATTKGVLVSPTVFGNVLLGPTAEDMPDKATTATSAVGLASLLERGRRILPRLLDEEVTAAYAGVRAATEHGDYQVEVHAAERYACAGGIRSTGLTASLAIAEHLVAALGEAGLTRQEKARFTRVRMPNIGEASRRPYQDDAAIATNPDFGRIVCHCERVTKAEIVAAKHAAIPARTTDGVRRRTRATLGRCQGFFCSAAVTALLEADT